jgi:hypothetical protein
MHIRFTGYAGDCRVSGTLDLTTRRLTDMLNAAEVVVLRHAVLEDLDDGHRAVVDRIELPRDQLYAVTATDRPRDRSRRVRTVRHRMHVQLGPYGVLGELHTFPGIAPLDSLAHRSVIVPLTRATIAYVSGGQLEMHDAGTLLVNGALADWIVAPEQDVAHFPGVRTLPVPA